MFVTARLKPILLWLCWGLFASILLGDFLRTRLSSGGMYDLDILLTAAGRHAQGESPYRLSDRDEHTKPPILMPFLRFLRLVPRSLLYWIWGCTSIALFFWCLSMLKMEGFGWHSCLVSFSLLSYLIPEVRGGQTNIIILTLILCEWKKNSQGLALAIALCLKPSYGILAAFFAGAGRWKTLWKAGVWIAVFCLWYGYRYGFAELTSESVNWFRLIEHFGERHIRQFDNLGIPSLVGDASNRGFMATIPLLLWLGRKSRISPEWWIFYFGIACWLSVILSPMAWMQNFVFLMPLLVCTTQHPSPTSWSLWAIYFGATQMWNHDLVGRALFEASLSTKVVLWASFVIAVAAYASKRLDPASCR